MRFTALTLFAAASLFLVSGLYAQTLIAPGLSRLKGADFENHVAYIRLFLTGVLLSPLSDTGGSSSPPTLTAQCTRQPSGKLAFELFANFGGIDDLAYHRPWLPSDGGTFPPPLHRVIVTMNFVGYTHVNP